MELDDFSGCNNDDRHLIMIKGHRTKRPRPVSQATVSVYSDDDDDSNETGESTVEDEIMANCLIYLAQSGGGCIRRQEEEEKEVKLLGNVSDSSRTEIIINKELFVYECKTCNRNFPSFQALGGHRASHKRPKFLVQGDKKPIFTTTTTTSTQNHHHEEDEDEDDEIGGKFKRLSPEFTIQLARKTKIHECSFCGSEFSSGQALGGHMRRHRNSSNAKANNSNTITNIAAVETEKKQKQKQQPRRVFQLDLNLPAPPEDDHRDLKFRFEAAATAASALVDCHY